MISRRIQYELMGRVVGPALIWAENWQKRLSKKTGKKDKGIFGPPIECGKALKDMMTLYYFQGRYADGAVPVAWVTSGFPVEFLRPFNFYVVYPENHGALCSARRMVPELSVPADNEGFSRDLCGYARCDIGCALSNKTPVGRLPKPDLLACCSNICETVLYWYRILAEHFKVPLVIVDTPYVYGEAPEHHIEYVKDQLEELVAVCEKITGKKTSLEELQRVFETALDGCRLWGECLKRGTAVPSPWTAFDGFIHMAPIVAMRGTEQCNRYYKTLLDELDDRVKRGIGGIKNEKYRLLWDNLPIWYQIRNFSIMFAEAGFNFVCATYTDAWADPGRLLKPKEPFESAARAYTNILLNRDLKNRLGIMNRLAKEFRVHGAVLHSDRSCKPYSMGQIDLKDKMAQQLGIKVLILEADHADPRSYSEEQATNRLQAFIESFK